MIRNLLFASALLLSVQSFSQNSGFGVGVIVGEPTGLSLKMWTGSKTAVDAGAAWALVRGGYIRFHADALVHSFFFDVNKGQLPVYLGVGGKLVLSDNLGMGVRIPFGIAYLFESVPIDVFLEVVPVLELVPATDFTFEGAIGIRYFF